MPFKRPDPIPKATLICRRNRNETMSISQRQFNSRPVANEFWITPNDDGESVCVSIAELEAMLAWCKEQAR